MQGPSNPNAAPAALAPAWRDVLLAVFAGALAYAISCAFVAPAPQATSFGAQWQMMSEAPFELRGQFPQRMLGPLLAHVLGLGGERFVLFARGLAILLLATVCFFCRRRGAAIVDALLVALAVALTAPIQMYKQQWAGYVDPLGYALFFGMLMVPGRPVVFWGLFFANLLNHELAVFLLPWAWFLRRRAHGDWRVDVAGAALTVGAYGGFYLWVKGAAAQQKYNADYFFANPMFPGGTVVICTLALVHLIATFGPILAVLAWHQHTRANGRDRAHLWLVVGGVFAIFCIAWDWSRHANLMVMPLVIASVPFLAAGHRRIYAALIALGATLMVCVPPTGENLWGGSVWPTCRLASIEILGNTGAAAQHPVTKEPMGGKLSDVFGKWFPEVAVPLAIVLAIGAAIWLVGFWLARRDRAATAALSA